MKRCIWALLAVSSLHAGSAVGLSNRFSLGIAAAKKTPPETAASRGAQPLRVSTASSGIFISALASGRETVVRIYDLRGHLIRSLALRAGQSFLWNGSDETGRIASTAMFVAVCGNRSAIFHFKRGKQHP
jgi:hypothetical protein